MKRSAAKQPPAKPLTPAQWTALVPRLAATVAAAEQYFQLQEALRNNGIKLPKHGGRPVAKMKRSDFGTDAAFVEHLKSLLREHKGNISRIARATGHDRVVIRRWLQRFKINVALYRRR